MIARSVAAVLLMILPDAAQAASAPDGLRGKTVVVTWRENRVQREVGAEQFRSTTVQHQFQAQVGSDGRVGAQMTNTNQRGRSGSRSDGGGWRYDFGPQSMTVLMGGGGGGGARRIAVRFDRSFASCTGDVIRGKETGASSMTTTSAISGRRMEIRSAIAVGVSCRVD
jgi:hypothetical protein